MGKIWFPGKKIRTIISSTLTTRGKLLLLYCKSGDIIQVHTHTVNKAMVPATLNLVYNSYQRKHLNTISLPILLHLKNTQTFCPIKWFYGDTNVTMKNVMLA